jgi:hypothetical protein
MWTVKSLTLSAANQKTIVLDWFENQTEAVQNRFLVEMKFLIGLPGGSWVRPYVGLLHDKCEGLVEIVLTVKEEQYRPIGYFSGEKEFTFLFFAMEKDDEFDPLNTCELAQAAKQITMAHKERIREINF